MKRQIFAILFAIFWTGVFFALLFWLAGCTQVIVEKPDGTRYKFNAFLSKIDVDEIAGKDLTVKKYESNPKKVKAITPYGIVETE